MALRGMAWRDENSGRRLSLLLLFAFFVVSAIRGSFGPLLLAGASACLFFRLRYCCVLRAARAGKVGGCLSCMQHGRSRQQADRFIGPGKEGRLPVRIT